MNTTRVGTLLLAVALSGCPQCNEPVLQPVERQLEVTPLALEFGQVPVGTFITKSVTLRSTGDGLVTIQGTQLQGAGFVEVTPPNRVPAGEERQVDLQCRPDAEGDLQGSWTLRSDGTDGGVVNVGLHCNGVAGTVCAACDQPPANVCANAEDLIIFSRTGVCVDGTCQYTASVARCQDVCLNGMCVVRVDAGTPPVDAGVPAGDAGIVIPPDCEVSTGTPGTRGWIPVPAPCVRRYGHVMANIGDNVMFWGGVGDAPRELVNLEISTGTVTRGVPPGAPPSLELPCGAVHGGRWLIFAGRLTSGSEQNELYAYTPGAGFDLLTPGGVRPAPRIECTAVTLGERIYFFGGTTSANDPRYGDLFELDPTANNGDGAWRQLAPQGNAPVGRNGHTAVALGGRMFVFGGFPATGPSNVADVYEYDPANGPDGTWRLVSPAGGPPPQRGLHIAAVRTDEMWIFGGVDVSPALQDLWVFNAAGNTWREDTSSPMRPSARWVPAATAAGDVIYLHGGFDGAPRGGFYKHVP